MCSLPVEIMLSCLIGGFMEEVLCRDGKRNCWWYVMDDKEKGSCTLFGWLGFGVLLMEGDLENSSTESILPSWSFSSTPYLSTFDNRIAYYTGALISYSRRKGILTSLSGNLRSKSNVHCDMDRGETPWARCLLTDVRGMVRTKKVVRRGWDTVVIGETG